jgi:hypothetical protein
MGLAVGVVVGVPTAMDVGVGVGVAPTALGVGVGVAVEPAAVVVGEATGVADAPVVAVAMDVGVALAPVAIPPVGDAEGTGFKITLPEPELQAAIVIASVPTPRIAKGRRVKRNLS